MKLSCHGEYIPLLLMHQFAFKVKGLTEPNPREIYPTNDVSLAHLLTCITSLINQSFWTTDQWNGGSSCSTAGWCWVFRGIYWSAIHNVMFWCPASSHLPSYAGLCVCAGDQYGTGSVQILLSKLIKTTWSYQRCLEQFIDHGLAVFVRYVFIPEQKVHLSEPCVAIGLSWREGVFSHERHKNQVHNIRKQTINNAIAGSISVVGQKIN